MKRLVSYGVVVVAALLVSACLDPNEEKGICSYLGTCEMGLATHIDLNYCKELGSCDDGKDPTEYTISGKPSKPVPSHSSGTDSGSDSGSE